jgi:flagellar biosynthesis protein FlhB
MSYNPELSGLEKLKKGSLYYIFSAFLAVIFIVLFIVAIFIGETFGTTTVTLSNVTLSNSTSVPTNSSNLAALSLFSIAGILFIVALVIEILGIINLRTGFSFTLWYDSRYKSG